MNFQIFPNFCAGQIVTDFRNKAQYKQRIKASHLPENAKAQVIHGAATLSNLL